ncbi:hypothetical protein [Pedobacter rhodius]|uniref:Uncharacterized protein n=1 Tax=Pedobacter rhodius TaxID=3004098 RepID=A0ABT4KSL9_9SPHI|nr:hypothetical protein [Pedobacter sp. SJ11]MCZ4221933.1 hypothetical protein [Pedobacter sp. SJ11]
MTDKEKSTIQEQLATLYLRLNGYFTTGYIIHSDEKKIEGELDILAVRFPLHNQYYTEHNSSKFLEISSNIDIIIAEVKSKGQPLQFNHCLKQKETLEPLQKLLRWTGVLADDKIDDIATELNSLVQTKENSQLQSFRSTKFIETNFGKIAIRPILFSPEKININNADKFINWTEINDFVWLCLCPEDIREKCGTRYDFTAWGQSFNEIVRAYKDRQISQTKFETITELYKYIEDKRLK